MKLKYLVLGAVIASAAATTYAAAPFSHGMYAPDTPVTVMGGFTLGGIIYSASNEVFISGGTGIRNFCYADTPSSTNVTSFGFDFVGSGTNHYGSSPPATEPPLSRNPSWLYTGADHYEDHLTMIREIGGQYSMWDVSNFPCEFWYTVPASGSTKIVAWSFPAFSSTKRYF